MAARSLLRAALFAAVDLLFYAYWELAEPPHEETLSLTDPKYVLLFSTAILALATLAAVILFVEIGGVLLLATWLAAAALVLAASPRVQP